MYRTRLVGRCAYPNSDNPAVAAPRPRSVRRLPWDDRAHTTEAGDVAARPRQAMSKPLPIGSETYLSTIERALVEAFAGAAITLHHLNTQFALGEKIDLSQHAVAVSAMVRVASRLGLQRRAKDVGPTLGDLLRRDLQRQREQQP
jgi:hypothetical protein